MSRKLVLVLVLGLLSLLLLTAATSDLARFTLANNSDKPVYVWLQNESNFYYLETAAGKTVVWTPVKGEYAYRLAACGTTITGSLDLTKPQRYVVPVCGSKAGAHAKDTEVDVARLIKLVRVTFHNDTGTRLLLVFHGRDGYVFTIQKGEIGVYTIPRGDYTYTAYACGTVFPGSFSATAHAEKSVKCP